MYFTVKSALHLGALSVVFQGGCELLPDKAYRIVSESPSPVLTVQEKESA
jgi:hypothetical protein